MKTTEIEVYDIETLSNCFTYTGYCCREKKYYQFVIHKDKNDSKLLFYHLTRGNFIQIGYNNDNFDYPVIHFFIRHYEEMLYLTGEDISKKLYNKAQELINGEGFNIISDNNKLIIQYDLFSIWHYSNKARLTSLKDLEFAMNMPNIEEMPIHHSQRVTAEQINSILEYNLNDVKATYLFFLTTLGKTEYSLYKNKNKIDLRKKIKNKFKIPCLNYPDVKIGEQLMLNLYARAINENPYKIKKLGGTDRPIILLKNCIPKWCDITSKEFNDFLEVINNKIVYNGDKFSYNVIFHGIKFDFGLGGTHACIKPGIYKSTDTHIIVDLDVSSLYPSIADSLNLYPEHLGPEFTKLYSQFIIDRINEKHKPKNEQDDVLIEGYKLILNGVYGKSNENTSFLKDSLYTFKTTIAGQLFICMWAEKMVKVCPKLVFLQVNTDGITIKIPKEFLASIKQVCDQLTIDTKLVIEYAYYNKMIIRDVNNYIAEYTDSTINKEHLKLKGCFEIDKEYHKDSSMKIVPIAVKNYFINNIPISETIKNHKNIYDFCLRLKTNSASISSIVSLKEGNIDNKILQRTTRYFISNNGGSLNIWYNIKNKDINNRLLSSGIDPNSLVESKKLEYAMKIYNPSRVNLGFLVTEFNKFYESNNYNINYKFYEIEANKLINVVEDRQLTLF